MTRHNKSIGDSILDVALNSSTEKARPRAWMAGFSSCGKLTAKVILASSEQITVQEAVEIVHSNTKFGMHAYAPSFVPLQNPAIPEMFFASIHAYKPKFQMREADTKNMANCHAISATSYMDTELNNIWERKNIDGTQYLIRANEDDPQEVLTTALLANTTVDAQVDGNNFNLVTNPGDFVLFFATETPVDETSDYKPFLEVAEVTANNGESISVILKEKEHYTDAIIPVSSVVQTIVASGDDTALGRPLSREEVINFLKQCYPASYGPALDSIQETPNSIT